MTTPAAGAAVVRRFLDECESRALSPTTIADRNRNLRRLGEWANAPILFLTSDDLRAWQIHEARRVQPSTLHSYLVAVRSFFAWAKVRGLLDIDPAAELDLPRLPKRVPDHIAEDIYRARVETAAPDMAAILGLAGFAGLRACEIARLGWPSVRWHDRTLRLDGKGSKERVVPMEGTLPSLLARLGSRVGPVIPRRDGGRGHNTAHTISQRANTWLHNGGDTVPDGRCPWTLHDCRHRFAQLAFDATGNLLAVADLLGHSSVSTTQIYAKANVEQLRATAATAADFVA